MSSNEPKKPLFIELVEFVNKNVGKVVNKRDLLLGRLPGRNTITSYLYRINKLGYVEHADSSRMLDSHGRFMVKKSFPDGYNARSLQRETIMFNRKNKKHGEY